MNYQETPITLYSKSEISSLELNYYIQHFCEAYAKIFLIEEISTAYLENPYTEFIIENTSPQINPCRNQSRKNALLEDIGDNADLYDGIAAMRTPQIGSMKKIVKPSIQGTFFEPFLTEQFFYYFMKLNRPVVYCDGHNNLLYSYFGSDSLKLKYLKHYSSPKIVFEGIQAILSFLINQSREDKAHELEGILRTQDYLINNLEITQGIAKTVSLIVDPKIDNAIKGYIINQLVYTIEQQAILHNKMGITRIDTTG